MLKMKLEKEGYEVIDNKMISSISTFGEQIYIDICLIKQCDKWAIVGDYEKNDYGIIGDRNEKRKLKEYACLDTNIFDKTIAQQIFNEIRMIRK